MNPGKACAWVTTGAKYGACSYISIFISEMFKNGMCVESWLLVSIQICQYL